MISKVDTKKVLLIGGAMAAGVFGYLAVGPLVKPPTAAAVPAMVIDGATQAGENVPLAAAPVAFAPVTTEKNLPSALPKTTVAREANPPVTGVGSRPQNRADAPAALPPVRKARTKKKSVAIVAASAGTGAAIGAIAKGSKGAAIGAIAGGAAGLIYDRQTAKPKN